MRISLSRFSKTHLITGFLLLFTGSMLAKPPKSSGPVFYLPNGPTELKIKDASGNKNVIKALSLVVSNSPSLVSMQDTHQLTLALWIKPNSIPGAFPVMISKGGNQAPNDFGGYELDLNAAGDNDIVFTSGNYYVATAAGGTLVNQHLGEWIHIVFTIDTVAQTAQFYVNDQLVTSLVSGGNFSDVNFDVPNDLYIGRPDPAANGNRSAFDGDMEQIMIFNRVLSASEIQKVFSTTKPNAKTKTGTLLPF
jgi:hypothetical protein